MSLGTIEGVKIEEKWLQRVKGNIFLDANFPVTHNSMNTLFYSTLFLFCFILVYLITVIVRDAHL